MMLLCRWEYLRDRNVKRFATSATRTLKKQTFEYSQRTPEYKVILAILISPGEMLKPQL